MNSIECLFVCLVVKQSVYFYIHPVDLMPTEYGYNVRLAHSICTLYTQTPGTRECNKHPTPGCCVLHFGFLFVYLFIYLAKECFSTLGQFEFRISGDL